jgi:hypothetical protein
LIQELTILSSDGIPLFYHNFSDSSSKNQNYQIIASYFEQICRFARFGFKETLNCLKLDKSAFFFYTHPATNIHIICKCKSDIDDDIRKKKSLDELAEKILDCFVEKFNKKLKNFDGNITRFKIFNEDLHKLEKLYGLNDSNTLQVT